MAEFMDIINVVGIIGTVLISTTTLFTTRSLQRSQQKATMMASKRSERIDLMREYSSGIISCGKHILYGIDDTDTKKDLICYADKFISLLQYEYPHDIALIDNVNDIIKLSFYEEIDKAQLRLQLTEFWKKCDIYVGVEYERLKIESMGDINGSGKVKDESTTFEGIYSILAQEQDAAFANKK